MLNVPTSCHCCPTTFYEEEKKRENQRQVRETNERMPVWPHECSTEDGCWLHLGEKLNRSCQWNERWARGKLCQERVAKIEHAAQCIIKMLDLSRKK